MLKAVIKSDLNFNTFGDDVQKEVNKELHHIGRYLAKYAQDHHRYVHRTGNLKFATRYWVDRAKARVRVYISETQAHYGKYVHDGHRSWSPDRFINNALWKNIDYVDERLKMARNRAIKNWNKRNRL